MNAQALKKNLYNGGLDRYSSVYGDTRAAAQRIIGVINKFCEIYGENRDICVLSVPGRSEIIGNHTDHNKGCVLAGAIDRDIVAVVSKNDDNIIRLSSEGYSPYTVSLVEIFDKDNFKKYASEALIAGVAGAFSERGLSVGGWDAYFETEVLAGSGLSSSAAFEVMIGNILNHLYNEGRVDNKEIAKIAQYAENIYFGKPCGLMDQMACAVGGFVYIDFENAARPIVESIDFSLSDAGYALCIVNTGGSHANLNDDYREIPDEMFSVAKTLGKEVLRDVEEDNLLKKIPALRETVGDRAILRSIHFLRENERVKEARAALLSQDIDKFLALISESGSSSFKYLQNVYSVNNVKEQGLSLALAITEGFTKGRQCALRVHGGGFAGTIQVFLSKNEIKTYSALMESVFGKGAVMALDIRPLGATRLF